MVVMRESDYFILMNGPTEEPEDYEPPQISPEHVDSGEQVQGSIKNYMHLDPRVRPDTGRMKLFHDYVRDVDNGRYEPLIDYYEFGTKWLALFNYPEAFTPDELRPDVYRSPLNDWVNEVAGSPYTGVKIIKDGMHVATVPPLYDQSLLEIDDTRDYWANAKIAEARRVQDSEPHLMDEVIAMEVMMKYREPTKYLSKHHYAMNDIFKLYGVERHRPEWILELERMENPIETEATEVTNPEPDDIDYIPEDDLPTADTGLIEDEF